MKFVIHKFITFVIELRGYVTFRSKRRTNELTILPQFIAD